ncbi:unnamed protein product [Amoebophrya sp. A25]|nr:unnamed protein product [Amoebophrya sp. A25]|eukprot:GSA25T00020025001.1
MGKNRIGKREREERRQAEEDVEEVETEVRVGAQVLEPVGLSPDLGSMANASVESFSIQHEFEKGVIMWVDLRPYGGILAKWIFRGVPMGWPRLEREWNGSNLFAEYNYSYNLEGVGGSDLFWTSKNDGGRHGHGEVIQPEIVIMRLVEFQN